MSINIKFYYILVTIKNFIIFSNVKIISQYLQESNHLYLRTIHFNIDLAIVVVIWRILFALPYTFSHMDVNQFFCVQ